MKIILDEQDFRTAIIDYASSIISQNNNQLEIVLPETIPTSIFLGKGANEDAGVDKKSNPESVTKASKKATTTKPVFDTKKKLPEPEADEEPEIVDAADIEVPDIDTDDIAAEMEGKTKTEDKPKKKRMFGQ